MTSQELKEYIIKNNKIEYILQNLGCRDIIFNPNKNYWTATQPDKNADNKMGVVIKKNSHLSYYSYSRNINIEEDRDLFFLIQKSKNISFAETMRYIHGLFGLKYTFNKKEPTKTIEVRDPLAKFEMGNTIFKKPINVLDFDLVDENMLTDFTPNLIYIDLYKEGIMPWTVKKFGLGYSYKWKRTIFPHRYWKTGVTIGFNARTSIENFEEFNIRKYFISPNMQKEKNIYGLWENYDSIKEAGYVVVYESEKSTLKRDSKGDSTGVSISGHSLSDTQASILIDMNVDIIISMDNDVPLQEIRHMCEKMWKNRNVYYTYDKHNLLPPKSSIADAKNKVFDFMMKYKIKYDEKEHELYLKGLKK